MKDVNKQRLQKKVKNLLNFHVALYIDWYENLYPEGLEEMSKKMIFEQVDPNFLGISKKTEGMLPLIEEIIADEIGAQTKLQKFLFKIWYFIYKLTKN